MGEACSYKICLVGETGVGKSTLVVRYVLGKFTDYQPTTIGASYMCKKLKVQNKDVKLELWDTAGQERYRSLAPLYYRGAHAVIVVVDGTKAMSAEHARWWINDVRTRHPDTPVHVAITKSDLVDRTDPTEFDKICSGEATTCTRVSSKTGENVEVLFGGAVDSLLESNVLFSAPEETIFLRVPQGRYRCW